MIGGDDCHRLALIADDIEGEHGLIGDVEPVCLTAGHILVGQYRSHTRHRCGRRGVD
jgi:hypothetical protein